MIKPFIVNGHLIDGELLDAARKNGLDHININARVHQLHWSVEDACRTPMGGKPKKRNRLTKGLKVYYMDLEECHKKYGMPGQFIRPERHPEWEDW